MTFIGGGRSCMYVVDITCNITFSMRLTYSFPSHSGFKFSQLEMSRYYLICVCSYSDLEFVIFRGRPFCPLEKLQVFPICPTYCLELVICEVPYHWEVIQAFHADED